MASYIVRRLVWVIFLLFVVTLVTFTVFTVLPAADPAVLRAGRQPSPELVESIRQQFGLDDQTSWVLIPMLGFTVAGCALTAILYGLMTPERWNARFNPQAAPDAPAGGTRWATIGAVVLSLLVGTTVLMASIVFSFQRYFEYQVEEGRRISQ